MDDVDTAPGPPFPRALERFPRVRQSILSTFDACALATKFDLDYRQGWSSHPAAAGQILHRVFGKALDEMAAQDERSVPVDLALALLDEAIRQHDVPMDGDPLDDHVVPIPLRWIAEMRIIVKTWAAYSEWNPAHIAAVERRLTTTIPYPDGRGGHVLREITGRPDVLLIDGIVASVLDWKTGWGIPSEGPALIDVDGNLAIDGNNISEEGYFWMRTYALLVFRTYPRIKRVVMREVYPRYLSGKARDRRGRLINPVRQATIDREELPDIEAEVSALIERFDRALETGVWRPAPGSHCSYCPRPEACTIFPTARVEGRITSMEEAERLAGRLNVLDAMRKQTRAALTAFSRAHGPVHVRDAKRPRVFGPLVRRRTMKPNADHVAAHIAAGGNPQDLYEANEYVVFTVHSPEEEHPHAAAAREEEEALVAMERAAAKRREGRKAARRA